MDFFLFKNYLTNSVHYVNIFVVVNYVFFGFVLLIKSKNRISNFVLSLLFFNTAILNIIIIFYYKKVLAQYPHFAMVEFPFLYLQAPLFFLYLKSIIDLDYFKLHKLWKHFLISFITFLVLLPFYFSGLDTKLNYVRYLYDQEVLYQNLITGGILYVQFVYYFLVLFGDFRLMSNTLDEIGLLSKEIYLWVRNVSVLVLVIISLTFFPAVLSYNLLSANFIPVLCSPLFFFLVYTAFYNPELFKNLSTALVMAKEGEKKEGLDLDKIIVLKNKILWFYENENLHLNKDFNLNLLANQLNEKNYVLSKVFKRGFDQNFYSITNFYRIEEAKKRLTSNEYKNMTIDAVGESVGFSSKSVFYYYFKQSTGITPAQYLKANAI